MVVFHGTDQISANKILNEKIDVTKGGGELGRGFYVGENVSLVASRAKGKNQNDFAVIEFNVDNSEYIRLNIKNIGRRELVYKQWQSFFKRNITRTFLSGFDVICAPYATFDFSNQFKFESKAGEDVINNADKKEI